MKRVVKCDIVIGDEPPMIRAFDGERHAFRGSINSLVYMNR